MMPQTHKNIHNLFVQKWGGIQAKKRFIRLVAMLVKGCKNRDQNRKKEDKEPQLHKATLVQRRSNTVSLAFSAGSPSGTCVEMQTAFTVPALKRETLVSLGFWVTKCSKINCFRPNQKHKQGINRGMLWYGTKDYHKDHQIICGSSLDHRQVQHTGSKQQLLLCIRERCSSIVVVKSMK